ncbi:MAG: HNH endonuclease [Polyangiaceae bacterium]|nr:HNH endonuclease [Polyangiaceae bacterium]
MLNRLYEPVRITTARRAFVLLYGGSARAIDETGELHDFARWRELPVRAGRDDPLRIVRGELRVPRVLYLRRYGRSRRPAIRLTRRNVMLRDDHQCQYCGRRPAPRDLNIDHVVPRSRGGENSWVNLVTACRPCNRRKGHRTPTEAAMPLLRPATTPRWSLAAQLMLGAPAMYAEWTVYLEPT